jgi:hypothetical protein
LPDPLGHSKSQLTEYSHNLTSIQLKKEYKEVKEIWELSGFGWDADKHVVTAADNVWDAYIEVCCVKKNYPVLTHCHLQAHPKQKKWQKTSFPLFDNIADLIEGTYVTGKGVFWSGEPTSDSSEDEDDTIDPALSQFLSSSITTSSTVASSVPTLSTPVAATMTGLSVSAMAAPTATSTPSADAAASGKQFRNGHRKSGSQAIDSVASSINRLADAFATDTVTPSPAWKWAAIHAVEDDGDLSDDKQLRVFKIIRHDTGFSDTILAIHKKCACTCFIKKELYGEPDN